MEPQRPNLKADDMKFPKPLDVQPLQNPEVLPNQSVDPTNPEVLPSQPKDTLAVSGNIGIDKMDDPIKRNTELDYLFMGRADDKIVLVGDELTYYGGELSSVEVPNLKVEVSDYFNPEVTKRGPLYAIVEGKRTLAFSPNPQKAKEYIISEYNKRRETAA